MSTPEPNLGYLLLQLWSDSENLLAKICTSGYANDLRFSVFSSQTNKQTNRQTDNWHYAILAVTNRSEKHLSTCCRHQSNTRSATCSPAWLVCQVNTFKQKLLTHLFGQWRTSIGAAESFLWFLALWYNVLTYVLT